MNNTNNKQAFNPFGMGAFNAQSGFGNLNDTADSVGSLFGFGPEDRNSVLDRGRRELQPLLSAILRTFDNSGLSGALAKIETAIEAKTKKLKSFKSSNSKAKEQQDIDLLNELKVSLNNSTSELEQEVKAEQSNWNASLPNSPTSKTNTMFLGIGAVVLLLAKFTNTFK